jgi:hypothetical protein
MIITMDFLAGPAAVSVPPAVAAILRRDGRVVLAGDVGAIVAGAGAGRES